MNAAARAPGWAASLAAALAAAAAPAAAVPDAGPSLQDVKSALDARPELFSAVVVSKGTPVRFQWWPPRAGKSMLTEPLGPRCVSLPISEPWTLELDVRYGKKRKGHIVLLAGRLPPGFDGYQAVLSHADDPRAEAPDCLLPKSGLSLLQLESLWIAFPTRCSEMDPYAASLPVVLRALRAAMPRSFPKTFIHGHCGFVILRPSAADKARGVRSGVEEVP